MDRREFLRGTMGATVLAARPAEAFAQHQAPQRPHSWDPGQVRHLLPTVSDTRILIKASFNQPLKGTPVLRINGTAVPGRMRDTQGEFWQFYASGLAPGRKHQLALIAANRKAMCEPWELATFPSP